MSFSTKAYFFACLLACAPGIFSAQNFTGRLVRQQTAALEAQFSAYSVFQLDAFALNGYVKNHDGPADIQLAIGPHRWQIALERNPILAENYTLRVPTENGIEVFHEKPDIAFRGTLPGGDPVRMTLNGAFWSGLVVEKDRAFYIEPLANYEKSASPDLFVLYEAADVKANREVNCLALETANFRQRLEKEHQHPENEQDASRLACYDMELACASDKSMTIKYGSVAAVQNFVITVANNVEVNYTGQFNHDISFVIGTQFVVPATGTDPWSGTTNSNQLLIEFSTWGENNGFGTDDFDLGQMWTNRTFQGGVAGVAWVGGLCETDFRFHLIQDWTANANNIRCTVAHEIGHNYNASHDNCPPDSWIMCPSVTGSNAWSATSKAVINAFLPSHIGGGCLETCGSGGGGGGTVTADFNWSPTTPCAGQTVNFDDNSTGTVTSWSWTFAGGTPATSTLQNPSVSWASGGTFAVTLSINGGADDITKNITVTPQPNASFTFSTSGLDAFFTNTSTGATSYLWNFGDGNTSNAVNPNHTYATAGTYTVTLTATNACGTDQTSEILVTAPIVDFAANPTLGCAPLTVQFNEQCSPDATVFFWQFPGGTPSSSTQANPIVVYNSPGTYDVSLTASNSATSETESKFGMVDVNPIATSDFAFSITGLTVFFTNQSSNANSFLWNFGDGNTSTATNPTHSYPDEGTYTVTLTAIGPCGSVTYSEIVNLIAPPIAAFTASPLTGCAPLSVQFNNQSTGSQATYQWSFPGGNPSSSTAANPTVVYTGGGAWDVSLTVTNPGGSNLSFQNDFININPQAVADFTTSVSGATASFTNTSSHATSYLWDFGDGQSSTAANPVHTYVADGTYNVVLTATNICGSATSIESVTILVPPTANFTWSPNPAQGCPPFQVQFSDASVGTASSFQWSFPGGTPAISALPNPTVTYNTAGSYSVSLTVGNASGSNTVSKNNIIQVGVAPFAGFSASTSGLTATFTNNSTGATGYLWNFGDGQTSTALAPVHDYPNDGTYAVTLTASNACGTTSTVQTVQIVTPPTAAFAFQPASGCAPLTVQFNSAASANTTAFLWQFPGGTPATSTETNPSIVYAAPGIYAVSLTASNSAGQNTAAQTNAIVVGAAPSAAFSANANFANVSFTNNSTGATGYAWDFGDGQTSTEANPTHAFTNDGNYIVQLTATNACGPTTVSQNVQIVTPPTANFAASATSGCAPLTVQFSNNSSANATHFLWQFPGAMPETSTEASPTVIYPAPGTYAVSLTASNSAGQNTASQATAISVGTVPSAAFSTAANGTNVSFTNNSAGATGYAWDFGDGQTSTEANPTHAFANDGNYIVQLTATNACGSTTSTETLTIVSPPTADFAASATSGCSPLTVHFSNNSSANASNFAWQFPGGTPATSTDINPTVVYDAPGLYSATLTASNSAGENTISKTDLIAVGAIPLANFDYDTSATTASFSNTSAGATAYFWDFGDGQSTTEASPTHTFPGDGTYEVTMTATNVCGSSTSTQTLVFLNPPTANFTASGLSGCAPFLVHFDNASSSNATDFQWDFPGGNPASSTDENPSVTWAAPGIYTVTLTVSNAAGTSQRTLNIAVLGQPTAAFESATAGLSVVCTNNSTGASSYFWDFGDGNTSSEANPTHDFGTIGTFTVTLAASNDCGTVETAQTVVIAGDAPLPAFAANATTGCAPFTVQFSDQSAGNPTAWLWTFPGGSPATSIEQNPLVTYSTAGTYDVTLSATNVFGTDAATQTAYVEVGSAPTAAFTADAVLGAVNFSNQSQNGDAYAWDFGDGSTSTEANPSHLYTANGSYTVSLTVTNACGESTTTQTLIIVTVGADEAFLLENVRIFPNPNRGVFNIEMQGLRAEVVDFQVLNALGQSVGQFAEPVSGGRLARAIHLEHLPAGFYALRVRAGLAVAFFKFEVVD